MERTYLFVPANRQDRMEKALQSEADAVIIDLEDSIAEERKIEARENVTAFLKGQPKPNKPLFIRINSLKTEYGEADVQMIRSFPQVGVMLPKVESPEEIAFLKQKMNTNQAVIPLIESAKGIIAAEKIATSSAIHRLAFGAVDYCLELGIAPSKTEEELIYPRSVLAVASSAAGLPSPIDTVFTKIDDVEGLQQKTKRAKQLGLIASLCIHPRQVTIIHSVLQPQEEIQWAEKVVAAFEAAEKKGIASIQMDGVMIDYPVYEQAKEVLMREGKLQK